MAELVGGCISWDRMCANTLDLGNTTLEEIEAGLDPNFVPEGWLDPPTPPKKKLKLSLAKKKSECTSELSASKASRFATPVSEKEVNEASCKRSGANEHKEEQRLGRENIRCLGAATKPVDAS